MKARILLLSLLLFAVLVSSAQAMASQHYRLDWFTPLTTGAGGLSSSPNFRAEFIVGQTVDGSQLGAQFRGDLGFWAGLNDFFNLYLPEVARMFHS